MAEPLVRTETYYECPFCKAESYNREKIVTHMDNCGYNPAFPEKHCASCAHAFFYNTTRLAGHDRGKRVQTKFRVCECDKKCRSIEGNRRKHYLKRTGTE